MGVGGGMGRFFEKKKMPGPGLIAFKPCVKM